MCGITGFLTPGGCPEGDAAGVVGAMASTMRHRGPDDGDVWVDAAAGIALGHRRLSILDLSPLGHQPMRSASGRWVVSFNGEIYNFRALRRQLEERGHAFRGHSDTEVLLAAVQQWGVRGAVTRFNGMFAFALWDRTERTLYLARDRAGEKPLYYGWLRGTLLFGSELKALRAHPRFDAPIDRDALALYLRYAYVPSPRTIFRGVRKLPAGTILTVRAARPDPDAEPEPYWSAREVAERGLREPFRGTDEEAVDALDELLRDAVRIRMESDVPLGAFLSGGIDSSTIVTLMQAQSERPVRTFSVGFREQAYDESPFAAAVARHLGTEHTQMFVTPSEALDVIPRLPRYWDEPFADPSQIPTLLVAMLTRQHVTVSLSGDAGDELFGGYRRYRQAAAIWRGLRTTPAAVRRAAAYALDPAHAGWGRALDAADPAVWRWRGKRSLREWARQGVELLPARAPEEVYRFLMSYWKRPIVLGVTPGAHPGPLADPGEWLSGAGGGVAERAMFLDLITYLPDDILVKLDRATMAVSVEGRIPLLDHRVIELAWRMPARLRARGDGKLLLRRLLYRYVPRSLVERPKRGFGAPIGAWLRGPLRAWGESLLDAGRLRRDALLDPTIIRERWEQHIAGRMSWDFRLWAVLMFQAWLDEEVRRHDVPRAAIEIATPRDAAPAGRAPDPLALPEGTCPSPPIPMPAYGSRVTPRA